MCGTDPFDEPRHYNFPGDGKPSEHYFPGELKMAIGRADFVKLPAFGPLTQVDLLRRYLNKNNDYRQRSMVATNRVLVGSFVDGDNDHYYKKMFEEAVKNGSRLFGWAPEVIVSGDCLVPNNPCLWGLLCGNGQPNHVQGTNRAFHVSSDFANTNTEPQATFVSLFGSYFLDFEYTNNLMRALLGTSKHTLGAMWFSGFEVPSSATAGTDLSFERLGLGDTFGAAVQRSINQTPSFNMNSFMTVLGDPTLRWQVLAPAKNVTATGTTTVILNWTHSAETTQYFVYRSTNGLDGPWVKLTTSGVIDGNSYTNASAPPGTKTYQVRAAKLISTGSGSYTNLSQGAFAVAN